MNIHKIAIIVLLSTCTIGLANQINMNNVRTVAARAKSEVVRHDENEEQDLDGIIDFGTEGELDMEDLKPSKVVLWFNMYCISPLFKFYNWLQKKN